jgi:GTP:adenosylcobinamide-phosphate guanylyltransferase
MVLAGGEGARIDPSASTKGLVSVAGRPMVEWVVEALAAAQTISEIAVVVPNVARTGAWTERVDHVVVSDGSCTENALAGLDVLGDRAVLVTTGDLPALTSDAIDDYVTRSLESGADFTYPLVTSEDMESQFPGSQRTYVRVAGGHVTGGNMMVLMPRVARQNRELGQRLFDTRKSAMKMARVIGVPFALRYVSGRLRVGDVERKMEQMLGAKCSAIYTSYASIGADVDKPIDVVVAERVLYQRTRGRNTGNGPCEQ